MKHLLTAIIVVIISLGYSQDKSLLWEINGNGLKQPSYLFGTIHIIPKKDYFFYDSFKEKLDKCKTLTLEVDMNALTLQQKVDMAKKALMPAGENLQNLMGEERYTAFKKYMIDSIGVSEKKINKKYNRIKPFFLMGLILKDKLGKIKTYEVELTKYAKKNKMNITGLEKIEDQLSLVETISLKDQAEQFLQVEELSQYDELLRLYLEQDLYGLQTFSEQPDMDYGTDFEANFITDRNTNWIPTIESLITQKATFIAVGALHLPGENGVITLLRDKGYSVSPVIN